MQGYTPLDVDWDRTTRNEENRMFKELYSVYIESGLDSSTAREKAEQALQYAQEAKQQSESTQEQLDTIVINGDSSVEAAQARVNADGSITYPTLKARLDAEYIQVSSQLSEIMINVTDPPSPLVGAKGDGVTDDSQALFNIHSYANENGYDVNYGDHEYLIGQCLEIPIQTNVHFGNSKIIIDESQALNGFEDTGYYRISPSEEFEDITAEVGSQLINEWEKGASHLNSLASYKNSYVIVEDDTDIMVRRTNGVEYIRKDQTILADNGKVMADICFSFNNMSSIRVKPRETSYITLKGGTFLFSGERSVNIEEAYRSPVFLIERCKTILQNMVADLLNDQDDLTGQATMGLFRTHNVEDVRIENVKTLPREHSGMGAYGFVISETINCYLSNVEGNRDNAWGVMQSDFAKNLYINNCELNRIDAHAWGYNFYVNESIVGEHGITVYGGGDLSLTGVTVKNSLSYLTLRSDYGTTWDGDLKIINPTHVIKSGGENRFIQLNISSDHDFNHDIIMFNSIYVDGVAFETNGLSDSIILMRLLDFTSLNNVYIANDIQFQNVHVRGRETGVRALVFSNVSELKSQIVGSSGNVNEFNPNTLINLNNITTRGTNNQVNIEGLNNQVDSYYPIIRVTNMDISVRLFNTAAHFYGENIRLLGTTFDGDPSSVLEVNNSHIKPNLLNLTSIFSSGLTTKTGHFKITNSTFFLPRVAGVIENDMTLYNMFETNKINGWIKGCHFAREVLTSGLFNNYGQGGTLSHHAYVQAFQECDYLERNSGCVLPVNDAPPLDDFWHTRGDFIRCEIGFTLGWKVISSGMSDASNYLEVTISQ